MFEGKFANGAGETSLSRDAFRMGAFMDFFRLKSMYYSHTGFYFATWMTVVTSFVYIYSKVYLSLTGVQSQIVNNMNQTSIIRENSIYGFDNRVFYDLDAVMNTQYFIQAGLFLTLPLIVVYFSEMGLIRGLGEFFNMVITAGPAFFVFQVGTTMHYFDNNILHGNAKYQATGRGFKITRETFVLLYKAYSNSHYRRAWEMVGLCLIYWTYGDFDICNRKIDPSNPDDTFASDFCETKQGYGIQTFAIWSIAILWLLSPFVFNADGLDYEKSKSDIRAWCKWMFMAEDDTDEDKVHTGGWISWWKSEHVVPRDTRI
jgi:callose synthase